MKNIIILLAGILFISINTLKADKLLDKKIEDFYLGNSFDCLGFLARQDPSIKSITIPRGFSSKIVSEKDIYLLIELINSLTECPILIRSESSHWPTKKTTLGVISSYLIYSHIHNQGIPFGLGSYQMDKLKLDEIQVWSKAKKDLLK